MKNLLVGIVLMSTITAYAEDVIYSATDNTASIYLCNNEGKNAKATCKEEAPKYQKMLNEALVSEGVSGSISVAGVYESNPGGNNCYLIIKLDSSSFSLSKKSESTPKRFNEITSAQNLKKLIEQISQRPGHVFYTTRNSDGDCGDRGFRDGYLVDSVYLTPNL